MVGRTSTTGTRGANISPLARYRSTVGPASFNVIVMVSKSILAPCCSRKSDPRSKSFCTLVTTKKGCCIDSPPMVSSIVAVHEGCSKDPSGPTQLG